MALRKYVLGALLATATIQAQFTDVINSNRPGESMAAFSVGKTVFQAEAGLFMINEKDDDLQYDAHRTWS